MKKELTASLVWAGGMLVLAFATSFASKLGYLDHDTVLRLVIGVNGLWMAWYGNRMAKTVIARDCARRARRVSSWSLVLSGLVYAGLWAFAPIAVATTTGTAAVVAGLAVTIGYCLSLRARAKAG